MRPRNIVANRERLSSIREKIISVTYIRETKRKKNNKNNIYINRSRMHVKLVFLYINSVICILKDINCILISFAGLARIGRIRGLHRSSENTTRTVQRARWIIPQPFQPLHTLALSGPDVHTPFITTTLEVLFTNRIFAPPSSLQYHRKVPKLLARSLFADNAAKAKK